MSKRPVSLLLLIVVWSAFFAGQFFLEKNKLDEGAIQQISGTSFGAACQKHGPQESVLVQIHYDGEAEVATELVWLSDSLHCDESITNRFLNAKATKTFSAHYTLGFEVDGFEILKPEETIPEFRNTKSSSRFLFFIALVFSIAVLTWGSHTKGGAR